MTSTLASSRRGWMRLSAAMLLGASFWPGCRGDSEPLKLGGETNWLAWCESDEQCPLGECVCGVCTAPCTAELPSCAAGPPESACFADGSFGHAALCQGSPSAGVCLPVCATSAECPQGSTCAAGACLPSPTTSQNDEAEPTGSLDTDETRAARGQFSQEWLAFPYGGEPLELPPYVDLIEECWPALPCPTLDELLSRDACYDVRAGCGLLFIDRDWNFGGRSYWYDAFSAPPVAVYDWSNSSPDNGVAASRPVDCDAIDVMCSTCGRDAPLCEDVPGLFPEPPALAPIPGCACELDGEGRARVSLDCFCSVYGCPTYSELVLTCTTEPRLAGDGPRVPPFSVAAQADACGQVWFSPTEFTGPRYAFAVDSGVLLGATASHGGPITAPCGTYRVSAGAASECPEAARCDCGLLENSITEGCDAEWFGALTP